MKRKLALYALVVPVAAVGYLTFHPGVAQADSEILASMPVVAASSLNSGDYAIDLAHSSLGFEVAHSGISKVHGRFNTLSGVVKFDAEDVTKSSVEVTINAASVDTAVEARDNHLRTADFFDVEKHPTITFKSTAVRKTDDGYVADGDFTLLGVTKKVSIPFELKGPIDARGQQKIGVVGTPITIKRSEYGMNYGLGPNAALGDDVTVRLSIQAGLGGGN